MRTTLQLAPHVSSHVTRCHVTVSRVRAGLDAIKIILYLWLVAIVAANTGCA